MEIQNRTLTKEEHQRVHQDLHKSLDVLIADYILGTGKLPSQTSLMEFLEWSFEQTKNSTAITEDKNESKKESN
jgi:hypothetical protein